MSRDLFRILVATFVSWTGLRLTEVALPLIVLTQTGSLWATGLVAGAAGIASVTSPWWASRLRHRITSGRALGTVFGVQAVGSLIVAAGAALGDLTVLHLCLGGLVTGGAAAVGGPATRALLADLGEQVGPGVAVRALSYQDLAHRVSMITSPPVAAWVVTEGGAMALMWADFLALGLAALLLLPIRSMGRHHHGDETTPRRIRVVLRDYPRVADGIVMSGVGWFCWFGFALGLAVLGVETGQPGQLVGAGMAGYGVGSLAGSMAASLLVTRLPRVTVMVLGWLVLGSTLITLPWLADSLAAVAIASAVGGFSMPLGISALNSLIAEHTSGSDRRSAFAVQQVVGNGGASLGMLTGGGIIALLGSGTTMQVAGLTMTAVPLLLVVRTRSPRLPVPDPVGLRDAELRDVDGPVTQSAGSAPSDLRCRWSWL